jgi:hypothetical protein
MARGTGETTRQMQAAPKGAVFVWCNDAIDYPKRTAARAGRTDLKIVSPNWLDDETWRGLELSGLILDHALLLDARRLNSYRHALATVRPRETEQKSA